MTRRHRTIAVAHGALLVTILAGCAGAPSSGSGASSGGAGGASAAQSPRVANRNLSGFSPAFRQGYAAGCDSAGAGSRQRDEGRYKSDPDYSMGWNDGYSICRK